MYIYIYIYVYIYIYIYILTPAGGAPAARRAEHRLGIGPPNPPANTRRP